MKRILFVGADSELRNHASEVNIFNLPTICLPINFIDDINQLLIRETIQDQDLIIFFNPQRFHDFLKKVRKFRRIEVIGVITEDSFRSPYINKYFGKSRSRRQAFRNLNSIENKGLVDYWVCSKPEQAKKLNSNRVIAVGPLPINENLFVGEKLSNSEFRSNLKISHATRQGVKIWPRRKYRISGINFDVTLNIARKGKIFSVNESLFAIAAGDILISSKLPKSTGLLPECEYLYAKNLKEARAKLELCNNNYEYCEWIRRRGFQQVERLKANRIWSRYVSGIARLVK